MLNIRKAVRTALAQADENQAWLAEQIGTTEKQVSKWVNSDNLNTSVLAKIAEPLGLTVAGLLALGD